MFQRLLHRYAFLGIELEHLVQQVDRLRVPLRKHPVPPNLRAVRQRADVRSRLGGLDERAVLLVRGAQHLDYETHLMNVVLPREEGLPAQNLGQDAPHRPDINRARVILAAEQQLRRPVPPRDHVLGHEPPLRRRPRQPKVAYFQVAVRVQEQVAGLQIAVQHLRGVNVLEPAQDLVQEILAVLVAEALRRSQDLVEVRVHQLVHQVDVVEVILGRGTHDVLEQHDVLVLQPAKELDLAERPSRVRRVVEGVGYLEFRNAYSQSGRTGKHGEMRGGHRGVVGQRISLTFLIATFSPVSESFAEHTTP